MTMTGMESGMEWHGMVRKDPQFTIVVHASPTFPIQLPHKKNTTGPALLCTYARLRGPWTAVIFPRWSQWASFPIVTCAGLVATRYFTSKVVTGTIGSKISKETETEISEHSLGSCPNICPEHDTNIHTTSYNPCANPQQRYLIFHWLGKRRMTDVRHEI